VDSPNILYPITAAAAYKTVDNPMLKISTNKNLSAEFLQKKSMQYGWITVPG
jgi:hypothetical protein